MMQSGMQNGSGWPQQQQQPPQNGNLQQPGQIVHIQGTTPVIPQQEPAQNAASKAAPGRLQNKSKGIMNRPKVPASELMNEAPEQADKAAWGQSGRKKLVNATYNASAAHGPA